MKNMNTEPITIKVEGTPKPQPRVRAYARGKHAKVYDPGTANDWKNNIRQAVLEECKESMPDKSAYSVNIYFKMPRPKGHFRTGKNASELRQNAPKRPIGKNDLDNMAKAVLDVITDVQAVWMDDGQVAELYCLKEYSDRPGAIILIERMI